MLPTLARPLTMPPWDNSQQRNVQRSRVSSRFGVSSQKKPTVCGIFAFRTPHKSQVLKQLDLQLTGQPQIWKKKLARSSTERRDPLDPKEAIRICFYSYIKHSGTEIPMTPPPWYGPSLQVTLSLAASALVQLAKQHLVDLIWKVPKNHASMQHILEMTGP